MFFSKINILKVSQSCFWFRWNHLKAFQCPIIPEGFVFLQFLLKISSAFFVIPVTNVFDNFKYIFCGLFLILSLFLTDYISAFAFKDNPSTRIESKNTNICLRLIENPKVDNVLMQLNFFKFFPFSPFSFEAQSSPAKRFCSRFSWCFVTGYICNFIDYPFFLQNLIRRSE